MGFPILKAEYDKLQAQSKNSPGLLNTLTSWGLGGLLCIEDFLAFIAVNAGVLAQFKALLNGLIGIMNEAIAGVELVVDQLSIMVSLANGVLQSAESVANAALSKLSAFPFSQFDSCPPVHEIRLLAIKAQNAIVPSNLSQAPGFIGTVAKAYKKGKVELKELEYRVLRLNKYINNVLQKEVQTIQAQVGILQAIVRAIETQFPGA